MRTPLGAFIFVLIMLLLDTYVFLAIRTVSQSASPKTRTIIFSIYWAISIIAIIGFILFVFTGPDFLPKKVRTYLFATVIGLFLAKFLAVVFFLVDDIRRLIQLVAGKLFFKNTEGEIISEDHISRSLFLSWLGLAAGGTLFGTLVYGFSNKYNYQVKRISLKFDNLPASFRGFKIVHFSDVHSGSFTNKKAVIHGVDKIIAEKADLVIFSGDLVNDIATEMRDYTDVFNKIKAPYGVFSTLGNHDYGDYASWPDRTPAFREKERIAGKHLLTPLQEANLDDLKNIHASMGWNLLNDENRVIEKDGESISIIGVQNWSAKARFPKYGNMAKAYAGSEKYPFKILISHDPSHWDAEVRPKYGDVDLTLSGHTHGMQFGVEIPGFKWSPVQYVYKEWDGLYEEGRQKLYVNPGYGFIGYPGRVGILPEITVIELV
ncbi:MAG TPA: metallophosphoesterase [Ginsengibacter sp.]